MVPMSFINVRALVEGEIKKCVEYTTAFRKRMWWTSYVLPSGIHLVTRIRFLPLLIMVSQASNDAVPAVYTYVLSLGIPALRLTQPTFEATNTTPEIDLS